MNTDRSPDAHARFQRLNKKNQIHAHVVMWTVGDEPEHTCSASSAARWWNRWVA